MRSVPVLVGIALFGTCLWCVEAQAQCGGGGGLFGRQSVGGIFVDVDGVLEQVQAEDHEKLRKFREENIQHVDADLNRPTELRKVSLRRLEAAISLALKDGKPLTDEMRVLAGLQRIRFVFVYPEQNDIVLAGYGEGWRVDPRGEIVGATTGRPVLLLDDLLVALRTANRAARGGITCSIDPTASGLTRLQAFVKTLNTIGDPDATMAAIEKQLGPQTITVGGISGDSHFAQVLVAADYRMKRLAMKFDPTPVRQIPSFLDLMKAGPKGMQSMLPRWWLSTNYDALLRDADGLAWELRGQGVKCLTEDDFLADNGARAHTGKANPVAQKWADNMTANFDELSLKEPIFGQLRNCMDLAVISALIVKEGLAEKAKFAMPLLLDQTELETYEFRIPKQVDSQASAVKKGSNWIISCSGGVEIQSWAVANKTQKSDALAPVRSKSTAKETAHWWWN